VKDARACATEAYIAQRRMMDMQMDMSHRRSLAVIKDLFNL
jgi:hypothetical protein